MHVFLDFSTLECKRLSECVELFVLNLMDANANYTNREVKVRLAKQMLSTGALTTAKFLYFSSHQLLLKCCSLGDECRVEGCLWVPGTADNIIHHHKTG